MGKSLVHEVVNAVIRDYYLNPLFLNVMYLVVNLGMTVLNYRLQNIVAHTLVVVLSMYAWNAGDKESSYLD